MKKQVVATLLLLVGIVQSASADNAIPQNAGYEVVPADHWAYECKEKLCSLVESPKISLRKSGAWTRMDFGYLCARFSDFRTDLSNPTAKDIFYTLNREFAREREELGAPDVFADKINVPPRLFILPSIGRGMREEYWRDGKLVFIGKRELFLKQ